jgi:type IV pilus assembly protein PilY1
VTLPEVTSVPPYPGSPDKSNYQTSPFLSSGKTVPRVLLVMSKDHKLFQQAYNDFTDMDGDGVIDTGFNPSVLYYGYFDSRSCYAYVGTPTLNGDRGGHFRREGAAMDDDPQSSLDAARPDTVKAMRIRAARAAHYLTGEKIGICNRPHSTRGGLFSGNWLNYVSASRMDVIRKILYGGYRSIDEPASGGVSTQPGLVEGSAPAADPAGQAYDAAGNPVAATPGHTRLQGSLVPRDAHLWGADVLSDSRWASETPMTKYYDISKYTPYPKPKAGGAHFFARTRNDPEDGIHYPIVQYILDADSTIWGWNITPTGAGGRYFDWVYNERPNPSNVLSNGPQIIKAFTVQVDVCADHAASEAEGCRSYPDGGLKPVGLLQQNGENGQMLFGLLTGSYRHSGEGTPWEYQSGELDTRIKGGVVRNAIGDLSGAVNLQTGQFIRGGLIRNIDSLTIASPGRSLTGWLSYSTASSWGNPVGEMLYEAVRFFARYAQDGKGGIQPTPGYLPTSKGEENYNQEYNGDGFTAPYLSSWSDLPDLPAADCAKPVILLIAEADSDHDGDDPSGSWGDLDRPLLKGAAAPAGGRGAFGLKGWLDAVTSTEGLAGKKFFYAAGPYDDCLPKTLSSLSNVKGLCPNLPSFEGTYSSAAVAYYAHTHDFGAPGSIEQAIDVYAVTLSGVFPPLEIPVHDSSGRVARKVSIFPANMSDMSSNSTVDRLMGPINFFVVDWQTDGRGTPYRTVVRVNFEDTVQGIDRTVGFDGSSWHSYSDWDMDIMVEYTVELVASARSGKTAETGYDMAGPDAGRISGILKARAQEKGAQEGQAVYYPFRSPYDWSFEIDPSDVAGIVVGSWKPVAASSANMMGGYTISGTTRDGTYMEVSQNAGQPLYATPSTCNWPAGYGGAPADPFSRGCKVAFAGSGGPDPIGRKVWRTFELSDGSAAAGEYLPGPLWLAAKYGGFSDFNNNGRPDPGEWEGADGGTPRFYFHANNISELPGQLAAAFRDIARSVSTGTSTSASVDTVLGGGVSVQTFYYPTYVNPRDNTQNIRWVGSVFGLFVDKYGNFREDDGDGILDPTDQSGDYIVTFNGSEPELEPDCYEAGHFITRCSDLHGTLATDATAHPKTFFELSPLFDTGEWLSRLDSGKLALGTRGQGSGATVANGRRRILYGRPAAASPDGKPSMGEFRASGDALTELKALMLHDNWQESLPVRDEYGSGLGPDALKTLAAKDLIEWVTGIEKDGWRSRTVGDPWGDGETPVVWRLGDIINSKPILVGSPQSRFDVLYGDRSYGEFAKENSGRRQMAYFGANDGMLHAINVGLYDGSLKNGRVEFAEGGHERGAEIWAYIPTSLLPHLRWLPDPEYHHAYYVDLKPLINDVKIGGKWRTVLLGGMRLGGRVIETPDPDVAGEEHFYSEVFALDITDPESDPKLLWRYSAPGMGLTVGLPSMISHVEAAGGEAKWYAVIPSGPATDAAVPATAEQGAHVTFGADSPYEGYSYRNATVFVLDAETGREVKAISVAEPRSFFNNPFLPAAQARTNPWTNHALYFGLTVSRDAQACTDSGAVYRLKTVDGSDGHPLPPDSWTLERLYDTDAPVTGAVNSTWDQRGNLWVLFGTGRLWSMDDVNPCRGSAPAGCAENHRQHIYGIKEELTSDRLMTFRERTGELLDFSGVTVFDGGAVTGFAGEIPDPSAGPVTSYGQLRNAAMDDGSAGYRRALDLGALTLPGRDSYEMVITQPKLVPLQDGRSLMSFTTFSPRDAGCGDFGDGYLYLVDTYTGLPDPATLSLFGKRSGSWDGEGSGQATRVPGGISTGAGPPTEAYVISSSNGVTVSASAPDASVTSIFIPMSQVSVSTLTSWREVLDTGFSIPPSVMIEGLGGTGGAGTPAAPTRGQD